MRTPSDKLIQILTTTGLCSRADVDACERQVRQLCLDLPDFDSVWLDALVQRRALTPWQAERLQSDQADTLRVGDYLLEHPLGRRSFLAQSVTVTSRHTRATRSARNKADSNRSQGSLDRRVVLTSVRSANSTSVLEQVHALLETIDGTRPSAPSGLVLPQQVIAREPRIASPHNTESFLVAPFVRGWSLRELLIRGGRMPAMAVAEIGRELLAALAWLETARLIHGDITLDNVILAPEGHVRLVNAFARRLHQPTLQLSDRLTLNDCDGVAPEQFGTPRPRDARSELHALGCLLWQLLTSRPVVLSADPITRMRKLSEHDVADVRGLAPDCPEWMARQIHALTRRTPELRPSSAADILKPWTTHAGAGFAACRAVARQMPDRAARARRVSVIETRRGGTAAGSSSRRSTNLGRWLWPTAAIIVLGSLVTLSARTGVLPRALRFGSWSEAVPDQHSSDASARRHAEINAAATGPEHLPEPDADGIIQLIAGRTYLAASRTTPGALRIICAGPDLATVAVSEVEPFELSARSVELIGVQLERSPASANATVDVQQRDDHLLHVRSTMLSMQLCVVQSPSDADSFAGIEWQPEHNSDSTVIVRDCVFAGGGYGLSFSNPPRRAELDNVLLSTRGGGLLCEFQKEDSADWELVARNVTQRFGFSLADLVVHADGPPRLRLTLTSTDCVYAPRMAAVRMQTPASWQPQQMQIQFRAGESGNPAVVPPETQPAVWIDPQLGQPVSLPESQLTENALLLADLLFASESASGDATGWESSVLEDFEGPKLTPVMPGIDATRLPRAAGF